MREFKLYLSGILYAYVYFENDNIFVKELDVFTNKFLDKEELTSEKNQLYTAIERDDLVKTLELDQKLDVLSKNFHKSVEELNNKLSEKEFGKYI